MIRYNRRTESEAALIVVALLSTFLMAALSGWMLMLLLGMFAGYMAMPGLAIGYWASVGIFLMVRLSLMKIESS